MPRPRTRRKLALFALAVVLFSALPCGVLAGESGCCGALANCSDAAQPPCPQLAPAPCCGSRGTPFELAAIAQTSEGHVQRCALGSAPALAERGLLALAAVSAPPALRSAELSLRSVILRL